jgi:mRNA-degrading endonuclease RelE of RelBE toxin-antitoxin system
VVVFANLSIGDLQRIGASEGRDTMVKLFEWCENLAQPSTRLESERMGKVDGEDIFRLRVGDYHIVYRLEEGGSQDLVRIERVRRR